MIFRNMIGSSKHLPQRQKREPCKGEFARCWRFGITLCLFVTLSFDIGVSDSNYKPTHYKQYILMTLNDIDQTYCLIDLYQKGLIEIEYNENLEATFKLSPKAVEDIKDKGIWLVDGKDE